jgi:hypothetical protein
MLALLSVALITGCGPAFILLCALVLGRHVQPLRS